MYHILIIEDDLSIAKSLDQVLKSWGYEATYITDFKQIIETFTMLQPHLILMDISLPFFNGYHWCTEIRNLSNVPIIFISSASENLNIVMAMNMGGDDFISKPFDLGVMVAKIQALLRRTYAFTGQRQILEHHGVLLNLNDASLTYETQRIELTKNDFKILQLLLENSGKVLSRSDIMTHLWESDQFIDDNTLTVNVTRLRKKIEEIGLVDFIHTKKGIGYYIE
jgi:DNA-binding response OmpR family regulator